MLALSEIQTTLAGGIGQGFDSTVEQIGTPIEHDPLDSRRLGPLGDELADSVRRSYISAIFEACPEPAVKARSRCQRASCSVIDDLCINMLGRAEHRKTQAIVWRTP